MVALWDSFHVDDAAAEKAMEQLNRKSVGGRNLTVNEAKPQQKRDFGSRGLGGGTYVCRRGTSHS